MVAAVVACPASKTDFLVGLNWFLVVLPQVNDHRSLASADLDLRCALFLGGTNCPLQVCLSERCRSITHPFLSNRVARAAKCDVPRKFHNQRGTPQALGRLVGPQSSTMLRGPASRATAHPTTTLQKTVRRTRCRTRRFRIYDMAGVRGKTRDATLWQSVPVLCTMWITSKTLAELIETTQIFRVRATVS